MAVERGKPIHTIEISKRLPRSWARTFRAILFILILNFGTLMINASQLVILLPLRLFPFEWAISLHDTGIRLGKGAFGTLLSELLGHAFRPFPIELVPIFSHRLTMLRTFTSPHHTRTRWPRRFFTGRD
jgi:sterol desaturase/sphingolipid hydroxylase (fatty acid hydroxylase superfamily)